MSFVLRYPEDLPITCRREEIVATIRNHQVLILAGETGSGKTTQLPKMCLEALGVESRGQIGCTQPRRVAAMSVSKRVAEELRVGWGGLVGCKMRFSDSTSRETKVKFMTDGILLAEIQGDPMLRGYSALILDEAHERSLNIDFLLGYLKQLLPQRPDLKVMVTSATIDTEAFSRHFGGAPIIEVSGRLYPVEIRYRPVAETDDEPHFVDAAIAAAEEVLAETENGDVLVFMPTERDIRDTADGLAGHLGNAVEVLTLYGRMAAGEQQRVFSPGPKRRVIVATNVAETSVTLPRIRYVIDSGLARVSRYNPRTRTKRLPVESVSQSSANQRAGRAGRLSDGVCVRLFEEEDFGKRPLFTMPEIQRSNLAEVILRMKAFGLGEIETFPFLEPPHAGAIRSGYLLLHELGALSDTNDLTPMGRELAGMPLDPSLGRMLVQAVREGCVEAMLVLAAGLSIPDPRERPEEKKEMANAAHKAFAVPESDFLALLKIWEASPGGGEGSKNDLRRFCRKHFLSFTRMQEWRDLWKQLCQLDWAKRVPGEPTPEGLGKASRPVEDAIHRCVLAAQLGHIGKRESRNVYKVAGGREAMIFPGSNLYERREQKGKGGEEKTRQPLWMVAGEIVQTSQLFARMVAKIDPEWAAELGAHLCEYRYSEPHWSGKAGRVLVTQRALLHGLEVGRKKIDYGKIDPEGATQIFIRGALVALESGLAHRFHQHNCKLREKIETTLTRVRSNRVYAVEERLFEFYDSRMEAVSSVHDLNGLIKEHGDSFLHATEEDLTGGAELRADLELFPDEVTLGNSVLPVSYHYRPGEEDDGVSVRVPVEVAEHLTSGQLQWMVPGLREEMCRTLLRALPRVMRRQLMPIEEKAAEVAAGFDPGREDFLVALAGYLTTRYGVGVVAEDWPADSLPLHLRPRMEVLDPKKREVLATRDLSEVKREARRSEVRSKAWEKAVPRVERYAVKGWTFGDLPESVKVDEVGGHAVHGYPGLQLREGEVDVRLYRKAAEVGEYSPAAVRRLGEMTLAKDLAWLAKELRSFGAVPQKPKAAVTLGAALDQWANAPASMVAEESVSDQAYEHVLCHLLRMEPLLPLTESRFEAMCARVRGELPLVVQRTREFYSQMLALKREIAGGTQGYPGMEDDLKRLVPDAVLRVTPHAQLPHVIRYLRAVRIRAERAYNQPAKDAQKAALIAEFSGWESYVPAANQAAFRWLMEEYRVQVFAQELGTAQPVSVKRLEALM